jgi:hypothetical protein
MVESGVEPSTLFVSTLVRLLSNGQGFLYSQLLLHYTTKLKTKEYGTMQHACSFTLTALKLSNRGVDKFFNTLARLASSEEFSLAKSENSSGSEEDESVKVKKNTRQAGKLVLAFTRQASIFTWIWRVGERLPSPLSIDGALSLPLCVAQSKST